MIYIVGDLTEGNEQKWVHNFPIIENRKFVIPALNKKPISPITYMISLPKCVRKVHYNEWITFPENRPLAFTLGIIHHSSSTYAIFSKKLTFLTLWYAHVRNVRGGGGGERNVSFSENFVYVMNACKLFEFYKRGGVLSNYYIMITEMF